MWLRGALPDVAPLLQPVAHSLLQCRLEVRATVPTLSSTELWATPGGAASAGYHVRHAIGSLDRLFTYARGEQLSRDQLSALREEGRMDEREGIQQALVAEFDMAVERALAQLRATDAADAARPARGGPRDDFLRLCSGCSFTPPSIPQRHVGQLVTTAKILRSG